MKKIKRVISADPLFVRDVGDTYTREQIDAMVSALQTGKYNKSGGDIEGDAKVKGVLTLDIEDEDYDSGVSMMGELDSNLGVLLNLSGYANAEGSETSYRPILRGIGTPRSAWDAATKGYVDDMSSVPTYYLVDLNPDGSVHTYSSLLNYATVKSNLTNPKRRDTLDVLWENGIGTGQYTRFHAECVGITEVNNGALIFVGEVFYVGNLSMMTMIFSLDSSGTLTTIGTLSTQEQVVNKVQSVVAHGQSTTAYPSAKAVMDEFQRKPVVIWEAADVSSVLYDVNSDMSANPAWQLTGLNMTDVKRVKIYTRSSQKTGTTASASTTVGMCLEMFLDENARGPYGNHWLGSVMSQKPNDPNRFATLTCAISDDKTKFVCLRMSNIYGTAVTRNDIPGCGIIKIVGYYD